MMVFSNSEIGDFCDELSVLSYLQHITSEDSRSHYDGFDVLALTLPQYYHPQWIRRNLQGRRAYTVSQNHSLLHSSSLILTTCILTTAVAL